MSEECNDNCCCTGETNEEIEADGDECCNIHEILLDLADEAWYEAVKDRIRKEIESNCGDRLDELAKIVSDANRQRWQQKVESKVKCEEYKGKVRAFFTSGCD